MADAKITDLSPAAVNPLTGQLYGTELAELAQSGSSVKATVTQIANMFDITVPVDQGGTGFSSYAVGDILFADTATSFAKLPDVAVGSVLISGGVGVAPSYGKVDLTAAVSGVLPVANGGTGAATLTGYLVGNGTGAVTATATIPVADLNGQIAVANGGTGAATLTGYVKGNGTAAFTASATIPYADLAGRAYLQAYSTADQTGSVSAATAVIFPTTDAGFSSGISMAQNGSGDYTRIKFATAGMYAVGPNLQFVNSAAADYDATIWFRQNGVNVGNSATVITVPKIGDGGAMFFMIMFYVKTTVADEYVEIMWLPENAAVTLDYITAGAIAPGIPSAIVTAERIA